MKDGSWICPHGNSRSPIGRNRKLVSSSASPISRVFDIVNVLDIILKFDDFSLGGATSGDGIGEE